MGDAAQARSDTSTTPPKAETTPPKAENINIATLAAGGIAVVSATVAIYGAFTGTVARLARNEPWVIPGALVIVFFAVGFALVAARLPATVDGNRVALSARRANWLLVVSLVLFGAAVLLTACGLSTVLSSVDRPRINAKWAVVNGQTVLTGTVAGSGFAASDQLTVNIVRTLNNGDPSPAPAPPTPPATYVPAERAKWVFHRGIVYQQTTGPDIDGNVTIAFEVPLSPGYHGMLVVASTNGADACPAPTDNQSPSSPPSGTQSPSSPPSGAQQANGPSLPYACLLLDAPPTTASSAPPPPGKPGSSPKPTDPPR